MGEAQINYKQGLLMFLIILIMFVYIVERYSYSSKIKSFLAFSFFNQICLQRSTDVSANASKRGWQATFIISTGVDTYQLLSAK